MKTGEPGSSGTAALEERGGIHADHAVHVPVAEETLVGDGVMGVPTSTYNLAGRGLASNHGIEE